MATKHTRTIGEMSIGKYWIFGDVRPSRKRTSDEVCQVSFDFDL